MLVTLLVGSSRGPKSTSDALGAYLLQKLEAKGAATKTIYIQQSLSTEKGIRHLLATADESDLIVLAAPLFADSHHADVVKAMELINADTKKRTEKRKRRMAAISNSGFPEARQNAVSLAISRRFALECGFEWAGGLALGGGEAIHGKRLEQAGGLARNIKKSLDLAAEALAKGDTIPEEAVKLMAMPLMPTCLYVQIGANPLLVWATAIRNGCKVSLRRRPYRD